MMNDTIPESLTIWAQPSRNFCPEACIHLGLLNLKRVVQQGRVPHLDQSTILHSTTYKNALKPSCKEARTKTKQNRRCKMHGREICASIMIINVYLSDPQRLAHGLAVPSVREDSLRWRELEEDRKPQTVVL